MPRSTTHYYKWFFPVNSAVFLYRDQIFLNNVMDVVGEATKTEVIRDRSDELRESIGLSRDHGVKIVDKTVKYLGIFAKKLTRIPGVEWLFNVVNEVRVDDFVIHKMKVILSDEYKRSMGLEDIPRSVLEFKFNTLRNRSNEDNLRERIKGDPIVKRALARGIKANPLEFVDNPRQPLTMQQTRKLKNTIGGWTREDRMRRKGVFECARLEVGTVSEILG